MLGLMYGELHRADDAIADLSGAKSLRPGFWNSYRALGLVYLHTSTRRHAWRTPQPESLV